MEASNREMNLVEIKSIQSLKEKEFLTVSDCATLLNCSIRTAYRLIENGNINAVNIAQRKTLVKRSEIDKLFEQPEKLQTERKNQPLLLNEGECYNLTEIQMKYGISEAALQQLIKRNSIAKFRKGAFAYVPKTEIDKLFNNQNQNNNDKSKIKNEKNFRSKANLVS